MVNSALKRLSRVSPFIAGMLCLLFLLSAARILAANIGLFHDELWDFIPAVGMLHAASLAGWQEIRIFGYPLPLVTGAYQGALKTWVSAPLLLLAGTSPQMILTLNALFGMAYLIALFWAILPVVGRKWAWIVFASPFLDSNFLLTAPMDAGPSLFQYIFISLAMGALFRCVSHTESKNYQMLWFFSGCILAQKLTSLPMVIGLVFFAAGISYKRIRKPPGSADTDSTIQSLYVVPALLFLVPLLPHLIYFLKSGFAPLSISTAAGVHGTPYFLSLSQNFSFLRVLFDGVDWYQRITLDSISGISAPISALLGAGAIAGSLILYLFSHKEREYGKYTLICAVLGVACFLLFPAFRGLNRPWHLYILTPLFIAASVIAAVHCLNYFICRFKRNAAIVLILFTAGLTTGLAAGTAHGLRMLRRIQSRKGVCITSPALYDAWRALKAANIRTLYTINYSIANPIYVLSNGEIRVHDYYWADLTKERMDEWFEALRADPSVGIVYRYCGCKEGDSNWIRWLNREPQIEWFVRRLQLEPTSLNIVSCQDDRQTKFVLISRPIGAAAPRASAK